MKILKISRTIIIVFIFAGVSGCVKKTNTNDKIAVTVSIAPQKFFVEKIGGDFVDIQVMVPPGSSPHTYEPRPSQMAKLAHSQIYFATGVEFEKAWLSRITSTNSKIIIVRCDSAIEKIPIVNEYEEADHHDSHAESNHDHSGSDPHIWLSPERVKKQVLYIKETLSKVDSTHSSTYEKNYVAFVNEIDSLQRTLHSMLDTLSGKPFMVFHPSWGYFAHDFHLKQYSIEIEGKEPSAHEMEEIISTARKNQIKTIFTQPQFSDRTARIIASTLGVNVSPANPEAYNWNENLISFAKELTK